MGLVLALSITALIGLVSGHNNYGGDCPAFKPKQEFDWDRFKEGRWYAVEKFDNTQTKCVTYDFQGDDVTRFREVVQRSEFKGLRRLSIRNKFVQRGKLASPRASAPADMIVRFQLNVLGSASFTIMDTDYENYALLCTCQGRKIFFEVFAYHRRSCTILQRSPKSDKGIAEKLHKMVNDQIPTRRGNDPADHDFDVVDHTNCNYEDDGKGLQIDADKIIGVATGKDSEANLEDYDGDYKEYDDLIKEGLVELIK